MTAYYVYRCFDRDGQLAYIGISRNVPGRMLNHATNAWWAPTMVKVTAKVYPSKAAALVVEKQAIRAEHPRWNVMSRWPARLEWTEQQWRDYYRAVVSAKGHSTPPREMHATNVARQFRALFGSEITEAAA